MKDFNELSSDIYGVLLLASMGASQDQISTTISHTELDSESKKLVMSAAEVIIEETLKHLQSLGDIIVRHGGNEEAANMEATTYLKEAGVNEELVAHILLYNTFLHLKEGAEIMIAEGRKQGKTEAQVKAQMKKEMNLEAEVLEQMYEAASVSVDGGIAEADVPIPPSRKKAPTKPARPMILRGLVFIVIAYLDYQLEWEGQYIGYSALGLGVVLLGIGIMRTMD